MSVVCHDMPAVEAAARSTSRAAIGLRHPHLVDIQQANTGLNWLEIHSENYLLPATAPRSVVLENIRRDFDLSSHGVGLSIGSADGLNPEHLRELRAFYDRIQPFLVSEHLAWSVADGHYYNDLLPVPYTDEALATVCRNIDQAQEAFGRQILIENPSRYIDLSNGVWPEAAFLAEMVRRTGCGLLFDVNNLHVSSHNLKFDIASYLWDLPIAAIGQFHVAGHSRRSIRTADGREDVLLIDDHGSAVPAAVWNLLGTLLALTGPKPVLVEWDNDIPSLPQLLAEAATAQQSIDRVAKDLTGQAHNAA